MKDEKDFYKILQVEKNSTLHIIKKAYRLLAKVNHPDLGGDEEKFKEIARAYSVLSDRQKREKYDNGEDFEGFHSLRDTAKTNIYKLFNDIVNHATFTAEFTDILKLMKQEINQTTLNIDNDLYGVEAETLKMDTVHDRILGCVILKNYSIEYTGILRKRLTKIKEASEVQEIMLELLEGASYKVGIDQLEEDFEPIEKVGNLNG